MERAACARVAVSSMDMAQFGGARLRRVPLELDGERRVRQGRKWLHAIATPLPVFGPDKLPRPSGRGSGRDQSAGFQMIAKASSSSCPAARPRLA